MKKFFAKIPAKPRSHGVSKESHETNETTANGGGLMRSHTLKGETNETTHAETSDPRRVLGDFEDCPHGVMGGCEACR
jgi:hypothetical protein